MSESPNLWEFVHCSVCFRLWSDGPTVPFWATGCGHILCNDHLSSDRSCATCGTQGIEVVLLKNDLSEPISHWFRPLSHTQHSAILASRFQVDMLSSLLGHYRRELQRKSHTINKLLRFVESTRGLHQDPMNTRELDPKTIPVHLSKFASNQSDYEYTLNSNGKRPLDNHPASSTMSFGSLPTPVPPARLTLPSTRPPPTITGNDDTSAPALLRAQHDNNKPSRPFNPNFSQYAYHTQRSTDEASRNGDHGINASSMYNGQQQDFPSRSGDRVLALSRPALSPQRARPGHTNPMDSQRRSHPVLMAPPHSGSFVSTPRHPKDAEHAVQQHNFLKSSREQMDSQTFSVNPTHSIHPGGHPPQFRHPSSQTAATTANSHRIFASTPSIRPRTAQPSHHRLEAITNISQARFRPVSAARTPARGRGTDV